MAEFNPAKKFESIEHQGIQVRNLNISIGDAHILKDVSVKDTQWSCVFNLDDFSVDYAIDHDFEKVYHLTKDSF